jgi:hypothetical protein
MKTDTIKATEEAAEATLFLGDDWFDPLEAVVRTRIRGLPADVTHPPGQNPLAHDLDVSCPPGVA